MICSDIQLSLPLYADGFSDDADSGGVKGHLDACPLCRQRYVELREVTADLRRMRRPDMSAVLRHSIKQNVLAETQRSSWAPLAPDIREWLMMRLMPYGVGVLASLMIGVTFLTALFSGAFQPQTASVAIRNDPSMMVASNRDPYDMIISPLEYTRTRLAFANESPSINPQGTLIAITRSLARNSKKDDAVVVVADIYSNGTAHIAEVIAPSNNANAVAQLEKAFYTESGASPFVPASLENRPESVRVVLQFQTVAVNINPKRHKL